jgi:RNA polymerase sigma-70 factor, ECF subfamily
VDRLPAERKQPEALADRDATPRTLGDLLRTEARYAVLDEQAWRSLVRSIADGDQHALHTLYETTHRLVFTLAMRIVRSRETAEEVTIDVFYDVWRRAATYDPANGSVVGWIMNQARSRAIDRFRLEHRKKRVSDRVDDVNTVIAPRDPRARVVEQDDERRLYEALQVLTAEERQAIGTAFFREMSYSETAALLNQPLGTVKTRIRSGLEKLRQALVTTVRDR